MKIVSPLTKKPAPPIILGPLDYRIFCTELIELDSLLVKSGLEDDFLRKSLEDKAQLEALLKADSTTDIPQHILARPRNIERLSLAFRTTILGTLQNESYRRFSFF